jgi:hypothetical protein
MRVLIFHKNQNCVNFAKPYARVVELVDTLDLKSNGPKRPCGFKSRPGYTKADLYD